VRRQGGDTGTYLEGCTKNAEFDKGHGCKGGVGLENKRLLLIPARHDHRALAFCTDILHTSAAGTRLLSSLCLAAPVGARYFL
jgi:hypothetical protein